MGTRLVESEPKLRDVGHYLRGRALLAQNMWGPAREELWAALSHEPQDVEILELCARIFFEFAVPEEAEKVLGRLVEKCPDNPSFRKNLATIQQQLAKSRPAAMSLRKTMLSTGDAHIEFQFAVRGNVDDSIVHEVFERDRYRVGEMKSVPATVLDIGAHIGCFSVLAAMRWPKARIIACEADPENVFLLRHHLKQFVEGGKVVAVEKVITAEQATEAEFWTVVNKAQQNSGGGSLYRQEPGTEKVRLPAISIGKLWDEQGLTSCDLLKVDCEGAECSILRALADAKLLGEVGRITGEWHCGFNEIRQPEDAEAQLRQILGATHRLEIERKPGSNEGHFLAELR